MSGVEEFSAALEAAKIKITKYDPMKVRPVVTSIGAMNIKKFSGVLLEKLGAKMIKFPAVVDAAHDPDDMDKLLCSYAEGEGTLVAAPGEYKVPDFLKEYRLNVDLTAPRGSDDEYFLTTKDEFYSRKKGHQYIKLCQMSPQDVINDARPVIPEYRPRHRSGVFSEVDSRTGEKEEIFNKYVPPEWDLWRKRNPEKWRKLPAKCPPLFLKLLKHLIPDPEERKYLYAWTYESLVRRCYVYLILCGAPGAGKNLLKKVEKALHGADNQVDGKKSTLTERFNSQLSKGTLAWFDELKYDSEMENVMKEIQNDYISIERKGVDATGSSTVYCSFAITNNKPRDNFIAFDARKFAPLGVATRDLRNSMGEEEIELLSQKVESGEETFDVEFVAQIAKWILLVGERYRKKWPNLEYRGPMFWTLAHTSMTRWQKKAVSCLEDKKTGARIGWDEKENAYLWSKVEEKVVRRSGDHSIHFPDYTSVRAFFDIFRDGRGFKAYETKLLPGNNILGDFWIYPLIDEVKIITEASVAQEREKGRLLDGQKEIYDL